MPWKGYRRWNHHSATSHRGDNHSEHWKLERRRRPLGRGTGRQVQETLPVRWASRSSRRQWHFSHGPDSKRHPDRLQTGTGP